MKKSFAVAVCFWALIGGNGPLLGQDETPVSASDGLWTVVTMSPEGAWGAATETMSNRAIANAIADCRFRSGAMIGCGAYMTFVQRGWSLGLRCGNENIVVAARDLADAELAASRRETELRDLYVRDMPQCRRVVTVDPRGAVIVANDTHVSSK